MEVNYTLDDTGSGAGILFLILTIIAYLVLLIIRTVLYLIFKRLKPVEPETNFAVSKLSLILWIIAAIFVTMYASFKIYSFNADRNMEVNIFTQIFDR